MIGKVLQAKESVSFRGYDIAVKPLQMPDCYNMLWNHVDKVHTISEDLMKLGWQNGLPKTVPVQKITPAVDIEKFKRPKVYHESDDLIFTTVARLHWKKGLEYTLEALALLKKQGLCFTYRIIGEGSEYERLKYAAYQLDLFDEVEFVGKIPHSEMEDELLKTTVYLQYSIQEGFCNAVLEAQALGLLCVVSDAEGLPENVLHEKTGWVVPKRDPKKLGSPDSGRT